MKILTYLLGLILLASPAAQAQFEDATQPGGAAAQEDNSEVESLYDDFSQREKRRRTRRKRQRRAKEKSITSLSELADLSPFEDVAVIQRRFLPKTGRFDISMNAMSSINNPFFNNLGLGLRGTYYFQEKYGLELNYLFLSNSDRSVTTNLENKRNVRTQSLTTPKNYMGAAFKWTPVYGKMTFLNHKIVPFDISFVGGGGLTATDNGNSEPTVSIGTGQVFALTKSMALRWDFLWNFYQAQSTDSNGEPIKNNQDDLFISVGLSFFFPEAKYR